MENLKHLMGAYLYQSWEAEYGSWQEAVQDFKDREPERVGFAAEEADELLRDLSEDQLGETLQRFGYWDVPSTSYIDFLTQIRDLLVTGSIAT